MKYVFFQVLPKRNELLAAVINKVCPETRPTTLISLCRTRLVERHEAFEVFHSLLRQFKTIKVMLNERLYLDEYGFWKLDQDTCTKVNGFRPVITQFPAIQSNYDPTMITVMKWLSALKPLSICTTTETRQWRLWGLYPGWFSEIGSESYQREDWGSLQSVLSTKQDGCLELGKEVDVEPAVSGYLSFSVLPAFAVHSPDGPPGSPDGHLLQWKPGKCLQTDVFGTWITDELKWHHKWCRNTILSGWSPNVINSLLINKYIQSTS